MKLQIYLEVLKQLGFGALTIHELKERVENALGITISERAWYYILSKLESEGYIKRRRRYLAEGRRTLVYPTKKLREFYNAIASFIIS